MRALRVALRLIAAGLALASLAAIPSQRVELTLTDRDGGPLEDPLAVWNGTRANPLGSNTIVRVVISPAPAVAPPVTFVSDNPAAVAIGPSNTMPFAAVDLVGATALHGGGSGGGATVTARIGPPYDVSLRVRVAAYGNTNLACAIGAWPALAFAEDGTWLPARTLADADVYVTVAGDPQRSFCGPFTLPDQTAREIYHFPYGAVRVASSGTFASIRAAQWHDDVRETAAGRGVWLARAKSGATIKLTIPYGPLNVARAGAEFAPLGPPSVLRATTTIATGPSRPFTAAIVPRDTLFKGAGGAPLIVGFAHRSRYFDTLFDAFLDASVSPPPYLPPQAAWSAAGPIALRPASDGGAASVSAIGIGTGTVTVRLGPPIDAHASRRVYAYGTLSLGCNDISDGFGVAFGDDGSVRLVDAPREADFYASSDAATFHCASDPHARPSPFSSGATPVPLPAGGGWFFPGGGVFFRDGVAFTDVTPAMWQHRITSVSSAELLTNARAVADLRSVLLLRTRTGRLVKLLSVPRSIDAFFGLYAVSRPDGTFAY